MYCITFPGGKCNVQSVVNRTVRRLHAVSKILIKPFESIEVGSTARVLFVHATAMMAKRERVQPEKAALICCDQKFMVRAS